MNIPAPTARAAEVVTIERFEHDQPPTRDRYPESADGELDLEGEVAGAAQAPEESDCLQYLGPPL